MKRLRMVVLGGALLLAAVGCDNAAKPATKVSDGAQAKPTMTAPEGKAKGAPKAKVARGTLPQLQAPTPTAPAKKAAPVMPKKDLDPNRPTGVVMERRHTGEYDYLRIRKEDKSEIWVSTTRFQGGVGDEVYLPAPDALKMKNFPSKALSRTFDELYMVRDVERPGGWPAGSAPASRPASRAASRPAAVAKGPDIEELKKQAADKGLPGTVLEAIDVSEYTYIHVDTGSRKAWVAATKLTTAPGDKIFVKDGVLMQNFHSKALNRTFDEIYFSNAVLIEKPGAKP